MSQTNNGPEGWVQPSELSDYLPRRVEFTWAGRSALIVAAMLAVAAIGVPVAIEAARARAAAERARISRDGVAAEAAVVETKRTGDDGHRRLAVYRYKVNGVEYTSRVKLGNSDERRAEVGDRLPIRYLAGEPSANWVAGYEPDGPPLFVSFLLAPLFAGMAFLIWRSAACQRTMLTEGRAAAARVISVKKHRTDKGTHYVARYEFQALSGATKVAKLTTNKAPVEGSLVTVLYDRDRPSRAALYPLSMVRIARG